LRREIIGEVTATFNTNGNNVTFASAFQTQSVNGSLSRGASEGFCERRKQNSRGHGKLVGPGFRRALVSEGNARERPARLVRATFRNGGSELHVLFSVRPRTIERWCATTPDAFTVDVKLHQLFSFHSTPAKPPQLNHLPHAGTIPGLRSSESREQILRRP
jgi:hypothetical protein